MSENMNEAARKRDDGSAAAASRQLLVAVNARDLPGVRDAIAAGADVNARVIASRFREEGLRMISTPVLVEVAGDSDGAIAHALLDAGADALVFDDQGWNALHRAVVSMNTGLADRLRVAGVPEHAKIRDGMGMEAREAAKRLNDQHIRTCAGFYGYDGRRFGARVHQGALQTMDWGANGQPVWQNARPNEVFRDHNGRDFVRYAPTPPKVALATTRVDGDPAVAETKRRRTSPSP